MTEPRNYYHSAPTTWSQAYAGWLAYSEANNEERKNGWKRLSPLAIVLSGETESAFLPK
jgi:hypothetical protein